MKLENTQTRRYVRGIFIIHSASLDGETVYIDVGSYGPDISFYCDYSEFKFDLDSVERGDMVEIIYESDPESRRYGIHGFFRIRKV